MIAIDAILAAQRFLAARPELDAAWLFGSRASGRHRADSDLDLALLFSRAMDGITATLRRGTIADELGGITGLRVDALDAERVAPVTFVLTFRGSRLLVERDHEHRIATICRQYALWQDLQGHYDLQRAGVRAFFA